MGRKILYVATVPLALGAASPCWAQAGGPNCEAALVFDTSIVQRNSALQLSILNTVDSSNYEQKKSQFGASLPGYFGGSFNDFSDKRSQLRNSFSQSEQQSINENMYQRGLSEAGARAFSDCVARTTGAPFAAWVSSPGVRTNRIAVTVQSRLKGTSVLSYSVIGATPLNSPESLSAGSTQTLLFDSPKSEFFEIVINGKDSATGSTYSAEPISLPPYVEYRREEVFSSVSGTAECGAGGFGNPAGNTRSRSVTLVAPAGYTLLPDTKQVTNRRVMDGVDLAVDPQWQWTYAPSGSATPTSMTGNPVGCVGTSPHTQANVEYGWTVRTVTYRTVKVP